MKLLNHYIDSQVQQHKNIVCTLLEDLVDPDFIIIKSICEPLSDTYKNKDVYETRPDVHLIIGRDGEITQLIPFNKQVCGEVSGSWGAVKDLGPRSLVIAVENYGRLEKEGPEFRSWEGSKIAPSAAFEGTHQNEDSPSYWERYTKDQTLITEKVSHCLLKSYKVKYILGYEEVCPGLKVDPGPAFPLEMMRSKLLKNEVAEPEDSPDIRTVTERIDLNYIMADNGLLMGSGQEAKIVNIKERSGGWYKVNVDLGGFIKEEWVNL